MNTDTNILELIRAKSDIDEETGCEVYQGATNDKGYGQIYYNGKTHTTHRIVYEASIGEIPPDFDVHHICGQRGCCRIDHLQAIPHRLNVALTRERTVLRWERLQELLDKNIELNLAGETHITTTDLSVVWGKNFRGSNVTRLELAT